MASTSLKLALVKTLLNISKNKPVPNNASKLRFIKNYQKLVKSPNNFFKNFPVHEPRALNEVGLLTLKQFFNKYGISKGMCILKTLKKAIVVRHPLRRLLSAYLDKYLNSNNRHKYKYFHLMKHSAKDRQRKKKYIKNPSFGNFVDFITDKKVPCHDRTNSHWAPYWKICRTFEIKYNYIVKFENLPNEITKLWTFLFDQKNVDKKIFLHKHQGKFNTEKIFKNYLSLINQKQIKHLMNFYKTDFKTFNYTLT